MFMKIFFYPILATMIIACSSYTMDPRALLTEAGEEKTRATLTERENARRFLAEDGYFKTTYLPFVEKSIERLRNLPRWQKAGLKFCTYLPKWLQKKLIEKEAPEGLPITMMMQSISPAAIQSAPALNRYFETPERLNAALAQLRANPQALLDMVNKIEKPEDLETKLHNHVTTLLGLSTRDPRPSMTDMPSVVNDERDADGSYAIKDAIYDEAFTLSLATQLYVFKHKFKQK